MPCQAVTSQLRSQRPDNPIDFLVKHGAELLKLGPAKRSEKRGWAVIPDRAVFAGIEQSDPERHIETRADIDGDDLVSDTGLPTR